jgi:UDP-glucose:(heptosyl)LPS alpha-1,3-glucosyltransferase
MRIALIRQRYNPFGGAERFVERALSALRDQGAEVTLITRSWEGGPQQGYRLVTCDPAYSRLLGSRAARDKSFCEAAQLAMRSGHYDITQSHERIPGCTIFRAGDGVHAAWLDHRARIQGPIARLTARQSSFHKYILNAEAEMFAHPALRAVICNSYMVAKEIIKYYQVAGSKLHVIYNGVDTEVFHPRLADEHREEIRTAVDIPQDAPLLLFVGSGFERKGIPQLLQAAARMRRTDAHIVVVGEDKQQDAMQQLSEKLKLADRVHFIGPQKRVTAWYGAADAFVLPTLYDPCPNAALEALASGLPSLVSNTCGAMEWVKDGENGFVVDAIDIKQIAQRLDDLCELGPQATARKAARASVEHLTLPAMSEKLLALYEQVRIRR